MSIPISPGQVFRFRRYLDSESTTLIDKDWIYGFCLSVEKDCLHFFDERGVYESLTPNHDLVEPVASVEDIPQGNFKRDIFRGLVQHLEERVQNKKSLFQF